MQTDILIQSFIDGVYDERLLDVYADETKIYYQRERYINAIRNSSSAISWEMWSCSVLREELRLAATIQIIRMERFWQPQLILILLGL